MATLITKKTLYKYTVTNTFNYNIYWELSINKLCCSCTPCEDCGYKYENGGILSPNQTYEIILTADGKNRIRLHRDNQNIEVLEVARYANLRDEIVKDYFKYICNVCNNCKENTCEIQKLTEKVLLYTLVNKYNNNVSFTNFIQRAFDKYECDIQQKYCLDYYKNKYLGKKNCDALFLKKFVSLYILGFYFKDLYDADITEKGYLKNKYNICNIKNCLNNLGIVYSDVEALADSFTS